MEFYSCFICNVVGVPLLLYDSPARGYLRRFAGVLFLLVDVADACLVLGRAVIFIEWHMLPRFYNRPCADFTFLDVSIFFS